MTREELHEVSQNIRLYFAPNALASDTRLTLLPVDLQHFYVFWNVTDQLDKYPQKECKLQVSIKSSNAQKKSTKNDLMTFDVEKIRSQHKVKLETPVNDNDYVAQIHYQLDNHTVIPLAYSNGVNLFKPVNRNKEFVCHVEQNIATAPKSLDYMVRQSHAIQRFSSFNHTSLKDSKDNA